MNWVSLALYPTKPYKISALTSLVTSRSLVALISEASFHLKSKKKKTETLMSALQAFEKKNQPSRSFIQSEWSLNQTSSLLCHGSFRWRRRPWHHGLNEKIVRWAISPKNRRFFPPNHPFFHRVVSVIFTIHFGIQPYCNFLETAIYRIVAH